MASGSTEVVVGAANANPVATATAAGASAGAPEGSVEERRRGAEAGQRPPDDPALMRHIAVGVGNATG